MRQLEPAARDFIGFMAIVGYEHKNPVLNEFSGIRSKRGALNVQPSESAIDTNRCFFVVPYLTRKLQIVLSDDVPRCSIGLPCRQVCELWPQFSPNDIWCINICFKVPLLDI
jgi:hypothetical protein